MSNRAEILIRVPVELSNIFPGLFSPYHADIRTVIEYCTVLVQRIVRQCAW